MGSITPSDFDGLIYPLVCCDLLCDMGILPGPSRKAVGQFRDLKHTVCYSPIAYELLRICR